MKRRRRALVWAMRAGLSAFALVLAVVGIGGGAWWVMRAKFTPQPPPLEFSEPADALEAQRQDVAYFAQLIALDRSFSLEARAEADRRIADLLASDVPLHPAQLRVALYEIAALADNGHTMMRPDDGGRQNSIPIKVTEFPDGLYVMQAKGASAVLVGSRVETIDGLPVSQVLTAFERLTGGERRWRRLFASYYVTSPEILFGLGIAPTTTETVWTFRMPDGSVVEHVLVGEVQSGPPTGGFRNLVGTRWLSPLPPRGDPDEWSSLVDGDTSLPVALREFDNLFRRFWVDDSCVLAAQLKVIGDAGPVGITRFLEETEAEMRADPPCALIVDLRFNTGGNYMTSYRFTRRLPELMGPDGVVYILTTAQTFSAAITTTAFIKQAMGERAVIVGEKAGDRLQFWAEGSSGCLPNAHLCVSYATGLHDFQAPCRDWNTCFWLNWLYPVRVDTLEPDVPVRMLYSDYIAGHDPVFERAVELAMAERS